MYSDLSFDALVILDRKERDRHRRSNSSGRVKYKATQRMIHPLATPVLDRGTVSHDELFIQPGEMVFQLAIEPSIAFRSSPQLVSNTLQVF